MSLAPDSDAAGPPKGQASSITAILTGEDRVIGDNAFEHSHIGDAQGALERFRHGHPIAFALGASFLILDALLGERDVATKVGFIEHGRIPKNPEERGLKPLESLPKFFDAFFARKK